jgi:hypothetical protein
MEPLLQERAAVVREIPVDRAASDKINYPVREALVALLVTAPLVEPGPPVVLGRQAVYTEQAVAAASK